MTPRLLVDVVILSLASYRLWRYVGEDTFPPIKVVRDWFLQRWGPKSWKTEGLLCPWCSGGWIVIVVVAVAAQLVSVPLPVFVALAVQTVVGFLGQADSG